MLVEWLPELDCWLAGWMYHKQLFKEMRIEGRRQKGNIYLPNSPPSKRAAGLTMAGIRLIWNSA
jgi:hypothetical protein